MVELLYFVRWKLRYKFDEWIEAPSEPMTLAEFELMYGNNIYDIVWIEIRLKGKAIL